MLACPRRGARLRLLATISDPAVVEEILAHLGRASRPRPPSAGPPAGTAGVIPWEDPARLGPTLVLCAPRVDA